LTTCLLESTKSLMLYPLIFQPIFKERIWGGRNLERLYRKPLPANVPVGESWEITDRPEGISVIANGPLAGKDLRWLMEHRADELLGTARPDSGRFPLLVKILDAEDKLSLQVHPPPDVARRLGGEPKTELWYIADARPGAELYVGLRKGVTRAEFERGIKDGSVEVCFHRVSVRAGDVMFLPSGRVHAIGAGVVIFEIQQNSDTTYRVFDWRRLGADGRPRELHVEESLQCIDFSDIEPALVRSAYQPSGTGGFERRMLSENPLFTVAALRSPREGSLELRDAGLEVVGVLEGELAVEGGPDLIPLRSGQFCLKPACVGRLRLEARGLVTLLHVRPGRSEPGK